MSEFDLFLCNDINTKGYSQWFYFSVSKVKKGSKIKFNIVNYVIDAFRSSNKFNEISLQ